MSNPASVGGSSGATPNINLNTVQPDQIGTLGTKKVSAIAKQALQERTELNEANGQLTGQLQTLGEEKEGLQGQVRTLGEEKGLLIQALFPQQ